MYANELHIPAPSPEEGVAYTSLCYCAYLTEREGTGVQPYIWESNTLKVGQNSGMLLSSRRADLSSARINGPSRATVWEGAGAVSGGEAKPDESINQPVQNESRATEWRKLISQVRRPQCPQQLRCWEKMNTLMFSLQTQSTGLLVRHC